MLPSYTFWLVSLKWFRGKNTVRKINIKVNYTDYTNFTENFSDNRLSIIFRVFTILAYKISYMQSSEPCTLIPSKIQTLMLNRNYCPPFPDRYFIRDKNISCTPFNIVVTWIGRILILYTMEQHIHLHITGKLIYGIYLHCLFLYWKPKGCVIFSLLPFILCFAIFHSIPKMFNLIHLFIIYISYMYKVVVHEKKIFQKIFNRYHWSHT